MTLSTRTPGMARTTALLAGLLVFGTGLAQDEGGSGVDREGAVREPAVEVHGGGKRGELRDQDADRNAEQQIHHSTVADDMGVSGTRTGNQNFAASRHRSSRARSPNTSISSIGPRPRSQHRRSEAPPLAATSPFACSRVT